MLYLCSRQTYTSNVEQRIFIAGEAGEAEKKNTTLIHIRYNSALSRLILQMWNSVVLRPSFLQYYDTYSGLDLLHGFGVRTTAESRTRIVSPS